MKHRNRIIAILFFAVAVAAFFLFFRDQPEESPLKSPNVSATTIAVTVESASPGMVRDSVSVVGLINAWRDVDIHAEVAGVVRSLSAEVGQRKSDGEPLLKVDDEVASSTLRKANINREVARRDFERYASLQKEGAVAVSSYEAMRLRFEDAEADMVAARRHFDDTTIKAPFSGIVTSRAVEVGDLLQPGMKVANMVDLSRVRIISQIPEKQVAFVVEGMPVQVTTDLWPGKVFMARVLSVSSKLSRDHTCKVESVMENPKATPFRAGIFARTTFTGTSSREALLIPRQALTGSIVAPELFVIVNGKARLVRLVVGSVYGSRIEVLQGLVAGDQVVVSGQSDLDDGSPVSVTRPEGGR